MPLTLPPTAYPAPGHELLLTPREFALLAVLVTNCDTALSRSQLLEAAWGYAFIGESRTVDVHINRLRRKLGLQNDIQTVYKVGYRLSSATRNRKAPLHFFTVQRFSSFSKKFHIPPPGV